jgi:hypothetical protein
MSPESKPLKMSSTSEAFVFTKLKGTNYATWADHMKSTLQAKYLWLIVKGTEMCSPAPPAKRPMTTTAAEYKAECKEHLDWLLRDEAAQGVMKSACEGSQLPHVKDCTSAKDMWNTLKRIHVTNHARINAHYYFEELSTRKYVNGTPMADHIAAILDLKSQIQDAGETLDDIHVARTMVLSLPKTQSWDVIKIQLFNVESAKLTINTVSTKLQSEANRRVREAVGGGTALYTWQKDPGKRDGKLDPFYVCRDGGHQGHNADECPHSRKNIEAQANAAPQSTNLTTHTLCDLGTREIGQLMAITSNSASDADDVLLDSAATSHMFRKRLTFTNYRPSMVNETVSVGNKHPLRVAG